MKKVIAFLLCAAFVFFVKDFSGNNLSKFDNATKLIVVCDDMLEEYENSFQSGSDFYYTFEGDEMKGVLEKLDDIEGLKGLNLYFPPETKLAYFQGKLDYLSDKSLLDETEIYYGYYRHFDDFEWLNGKKINVQLALTSEGWVMGLPMILTGF